MDKGNPGELVRFGEFEADFRAGELRKHNLRVKLQKQPFQVLEMLLQHPRDVISREELQQRIWPADTFVDFDHGLSNAIQRLREALGDSAESPRFIETIPRRGYRFLASVAWATLECQSSIAVLPFLNLSADPENELFADGMSEEIISTLMQIKQLRVAARTSSFSFKGKHVDLREIGERLNVRTVLEGSVRRSGNHLRVTAQLVNVSDGYHLWSEKYDREMKDIFEVQDEIAHSIMRRLEVTLESERASSGRAGTDNLEAFKSYIQGRLLFSQRGMRLLGALECFKQAAGKDPHYAHAWSGIADAYNLLGFYGLLRPEACLPHAREAAQRAVAINSALAETHNSLALSRLFCDWDRLSAEREFLFALELNPHYALALHWYALFYLEWAAGRFEEGIARAKEAVESDPLSGWARGILVFSYLNAGDLDQTVTAAEATLQIEPESFIARWALLTAYNAKRQFARAAIFGESALGVTGRAAWMMASLARTYRELGRSEDSRALYMELLWRAKREYVSPAVLGWAASAAGEQNEAIRHAREADRINDPTLIAAKYWPDFALLREDSRFDEILKRRGWR